MEPSPTFSLLNYDWVGFDMDHTLVRYQVDNLQRHIFNCAIKYLVEVAKYSEVLQKASYNQDKFIKGIFMDKKLGNFLKLDAYRQIAYHGTHRYTQAQISELYPTPIEFEGVTSERYWCATSYFEIPFFVAAAHMVDLVDSELVQNGQTPHENRTELGRYDQINQDIFKAILYNYGDWTTGWYFPELRAHPEKYIERRESVRTWLQELRKCGRKVFLLTNSGDEYSQCLMQYAFGGDWKDLFDLLVYKARKPYFHVLDKPFFTFEDGKPHPEPCTSYGSTKELVGGNAEVFIKQILKSEKVCYFGDEIISDVMTPASHLKWATVAIVEELENLEEEHGLNFNDALDSDCLHQTAEWGSYFFADVGKLSYWGYALKTFATIYVPCVSRWSRFPVNSRFTVTERTSEALLVSVPIPGEANPANWLVPSKQALEHALNVVHKLDQEVKPNQNGINKLVVERS